MSEETFNPLDKRNLGVSVADALLAKTSVSLPPVESFDGAGIYVIYYTGGFPAYKKIAEKNRGGKFEAPIYIGKAIPAGGRKGALDPNTKAGPVLFRRLGEHADSIRQANGNLKPEDFYCRYLLVLEKISANGRNQAQSRRIGSRRRPSKSEVRAGFEPANNGFADHPLRPLGYRTEIVIVE